MAASEMFERIIDEVRSSNLNFQIQMTPFSANIVIKKTLIRDNSGFPLIPTTYPNHDNEQKKNYKKVTEEMEALKVSHTTVQNDLEEVRTENKYYQEVIKNLQETLEKKKEIENHEDKKKNRAQNKAEIEMVNQKPTENLPKRLSKEGKSNNAKVESEIDTFDDDIDVNFNYN